MKSSFLFTEVFATKAGLFVDLLWEETDFVSTNVIIHETAFLETETSKW